MDRLPPEILTDIWKYLPCKDLLSVLVVSKTFAATSNSNSVWQEGVRNSGLDKYYSFDLDNDLVGLGVDLECVPELYGHLENVEVNYIDLCMTIHSYLRFRHYQRTMLSTEPRVYTAYDNITPKSILHSNKKYLCGLIRHYDTPDDADNKLEVLNIQNTPLFYGSIDFDVSDVNRKVELTEDLVVVINHGCAFVYQMPLVKHLVIRDLAATSVGIPSILEIMAIDLRSVHTVSNMCICTTKRYIFACSSSTITIIDSLKYTTKDYFLPALIGYPVGIPVLEILDCICSRNHLILKVKSSATLLFVFRLRYEPTVVVDSFVPNLLMDSELIFDGDNFLYFQRQSESAKEVKVYSGSTYVKSLCILSDKLVFTNQGILCITSSTSFDLITCKGDELKFEFDQKYETAIYSEIVHDYIIILEDVALIGLKYGLIITFCYNPERRIFKQYRVMERKHWAHQIEILHYFDGIIFTYGMMRNEFCYSVFDYRVPLI